MKTALLIIALLFANALFAQQQAKIKLLAQQLATATSKYDYVGIINHTDPKVIALNGGRDTLLKYMAWIFSMAKEQGVVIKNVVAGNPGEIIKIGDHLFCMVPQTLTTSVNNSGLGVAGTHTQTLYTIAVSKNAGVTWYFISSGSVTNEMLYQLYPELKDKITFPLPAPLQ